MRVEFLIFFRKFRFLFSIFAQFFLIVVFASCSESPRFSAPETVQNTLKMPLLHLKRKTVAVWRDSCSLRTLRRLDLGLEKGVQRSDLDLKKRVFGGENRHDPEQSKGLETRIKTSLEPPKQIQCQNPPTGIPNFERRAAAAAARPCSAFAPATLLEHWLQVDSRFAASRSRSRYYRRIVSFPQQQIRWNAL